MTGRVASIKENWNLPYTAAFIICPVVQFPGLDVLARVAVSSVKGESEDYQSSIPVENLQTRRKIGNMSVCVKPFHYNYNRAVWLVEFIEMYQLLGADHFIFYNHTVGPDVDKVLRHYMKQGTAEVLPWSLPVKTKTVSSKVNSLIHIFDIINRYHYCGCVFIVIS